jgi:hypothetical protein
MRRSFGSRSSAPAKRSSSIARPSRMDPRMRPVAGSAHRPDPRAGPLCNADDAPVPVLAPDNGKTKTGLLLTYVRDDHRVRDRIVCWFTFRRAFAASHEPLSRPFGRMLTQALPCYPKMASARRTVGLWDTASLVSICRIRAWKRRSIRPPALRRFMSMDLASSISVESASVESTPNLPVSRR